MKRYIKSSDVVREYEVTVTFSGYIGSDQFYRVDATSKEDAIDAALDEAEEELGVISVTHVEDDEYEVVVGFAGLTGVENTYTVYAEDEDDAETLAIEEAKWDLSADVTDVIEYEEFD